MIEALNKIGNGIDDDNFKALQVFRAKIMNRCKKDHKGIYLRKNWFIRFLEVNEKIKAGEQYRKDGEYSERPIGTILLEDYKIMPKVGQKLRNKIYIKKFGKN